MSMKALLLLAAMGVAAGVSFGRKKGGNVGSTGLLKRNMGAGAPLAADNFPTGATPGAFPNVPRGTGSRRLQGIAKDVATETAAPGAFPQGTGPDRIPNKKQEEGSPGDVLNGRSSTPQSQERVPDVSRPVASKSPGLGRPSADRRHVRPGRDERDARVSGSGLFDKDGNARTKEDVMAFERELLRRAASRRGEKYIDEPVQKKPKRRSGSRSTYVDGDEFGKPLQPPREPTRLARVRPDGHEHTTASAAAGFTGLEYGRTVDPHGKEYLTHRVTDFLKVKSPEKNADHSVVLEGDAHYEATVQEQLYHYRVQNTAKDKTVEMVTFTATLPEGSKPHHMYWIRNERGVQRPEHHECYIKRLTVTCNVHRLASGQLATIYVHAKQRPSGHGPMIATLSVGGKQIRTTTI